MISYKPSMSRPFGFLPAFYDRVVADWDTGYISCLYRLFYDKNWASLSKRNI
jgi:hypothetical protein